MVSGWVNGSAASLVLAGLALAAALLCWPAGLGPRRLATIFPAPVRRWRLRAAVRPGAPVVIGASAAGGVAVAGVGGGVAAALVAAVVRRRVRAARAQRRVDAASAELAEALTDLVGSLRAGAHPAAAVAAVETAVDCSEIGSAEVGEVFTAVGSTARLGGDVPGQLLRLAADDGPLAGELTRLAGAWALAERHGVALAELLDAVRHDVDARVRFGRRVRAQLAGARATTTVLAALPVLGVVLGQGVGAQPWRVLTVTTGGQVLLVIGVALACAGMLWSDRITARAVRR